jgi:cell division protein FtsL
MREKALRILAITAGLLLSLVIIFIAVNMLSDLLSETVK